MLSHILGIIELSALGRIKIILLLFISHCHHQESFHCYDWKPVYQCLDQYFNHGQHSPLTLGSFGDRQVVLLLVEMTEEYPVI